MTAAAPSCSAAWTTTMPCSIDSYRRFLLNGIYWAARGKVPADGVQSKTPADIKPYAPAPAPSRQ